MFSKDSGNQETENNVGNRKHGTSSLYLDFTIFIRNLNSVGLHRETECDKSILMLITVALV